MRIHARFRLDQVNRAQSYYKEPGSTEPAKAIESAYVLLGAVQGEPFGAATPTGRIDMLIVNPAASRMFFDSPIGQQFDVFFSPVESEDANGRI
jgi:hypothetical protein